jgi:3-oxoadipate enol-lactonase
VLLFCRHAHDHGRNENNGGIIMRVAANGVTLNCRLEGNENGEWLVLSHAIATNLSLWDEQISWLGRHYRILRYDTRGHGASSVPGDVYQMDDLVADAVALLDHFSIDRAHYVGLSLGGMTALGLAIHHSDRLLSIGVCDARADAPAEFRDPWDERIHVVRSEGMAALVEPTVRRWFLPETFNRRGSVIDPVRSMIRDTPADGFVGCARALQGLDYEGSLAQITVPTLLLAGDADGPIPEINERMEQVIPRATRVVINGAGHISNVEQPEAFNRALSAFLASVGTTPVADEMVSR